MNLGNSSGAGQFCLRGIAGNKDLGAVLLGGVSVDKIFTAAMRRCHASLQHGVGNTVVGFDAFLRAPDFGHDVGPADRLGSSQWLDPPDGPAVAGDEQRLALLDLVQDLLGLLVQLFGG